MDIHKPKPWHGWREFLKEYAIIFVGVLTALAAEQAVEALRHRSEAREMLRKLHDEGIENGRVIAHDLAACRIVSAWADRSGSEVIAALQAGRPPAPPTPAPGVAFVPPADAAWLTIRDSALLPIMPKLTVDNYGKLDMMVELVRGAVSENIQSNGQILGVVMAAHGRPMDQPLAEQFLQRLGEYRGGWNARCAWIANFGEMNQMALAGRRIDVDVVERPPGTDSKTSSGE